MTAGFLSLLSRANGLPEDTHWIIGPGMGFRASHLWWGEPARQRPEPHNGIDLREYEGGSLHAGAVVPLALAGRIVHSCPDFIGTSLFALHDAPVQGRTLVTAYAHMSPLVVSSGTILPAGSPIGRIAAPRSSAPAHLHVSAMLIPQGCDLSGMTWDTLGADGRVRFVDPLEALAG